MNSHKLEKYAACLLVAVLSLVLGIEQAFASPASAVNSASGVTDGNAGAGQPTCLC